MEIPQDEYRRIAESIHSDDSPVGIDARKAHVVILYRLQQIEDRLRRLEEKVGTGE